MSFTPPEGNKAIMAADNNALTNPTADEFKTANGIFSTSTTQIAFGHTSVAGSKGWYIDKISTIVEGSTSATLHVIGAFPTGNASMVSSFADEPTSLLDGVAIDDRLTWISHLTQFTSSSGPFEHYALLKVTAIDTVKNTLTVVIDSSLPAEPTDVGGTTFTLWRIFQDYVLGNAFIAYPETNPDVYSIRIPTKPTIGAVVVCPDALSSGTSVAALGEGAVAAGRESATASNHSLVVGRSNAVSGYSSGAIGQGNIVYGQKNFAAGSTNTTAGLGAIALGYQNQAGDTSKNGQYSYALAAGKSCSATGKAAIALGEGASATADGQVAVGKFNATDAAAAFIVGNGTSTSARSNALKVTTAGVVTTAGSITSGGEVTDVHGGTIAGSLKSANNLYDVADAATSRANLDVYSKTETDTEISNGITTDTYAGINTYNKTVQGALNELNAIALGQPTITTYINTATTLANTLPASPLTLAASVTTTPIGSLVTPQYSFAYTLTTAGFLSPSSLYQILIYFSSMQTTVNYSFRFVYTFKKGTGSAVNIVDTTITTAFNVENPAFAFNFNRNNLTSNIPFAIGDTVTLDIYISKSSGTTDSINILSSSAQPSTFIRNGGEVNSNNVSDYNGFDNQSQYYRNRGYDVTTLTSSKAGRYSVNGGTITTKPFLTGAPSTFALCTQNFVGTMTRGTMVFTCTAGGCTLTDGTNTLTATGLSISDWLSTQIVILSSTAKIIINGNTVASGTFAYVDDYVPVVITGTGYISRIKVFSFDMSASGADYTVAQYNSGIEEAPRLRSMSMPIRNLAAVYPVVSAGLYSGWQSASSGNCTIAYSGDTLVATQTTNASNYNTGVSYWSSRFIRKGCAISFSVAAGTTTCATACTAAIAVVYTDGTTATVATSAEGAIGILPAVSGSLTAAKDVYRLQVVVLNNAKLIGETFTWGDIVVRANGAICDLSDSASICEIVDKSGNWNHAFFTGNVRFDKSDNSAAQDTLSFANGATGGLPVGGSTNVLPMLPNTYYTLILSASASASFKVGTSDNATAYSASIALSTTPTTLVIPIGSTLPANLVITPVSALGSAMTVECIITKQDRR